LHLFLYGMAKFGIVDATASLRKIGNKFHGDVAKLCEAVRSQPCSNKFHNIIHVTFFANKM
jgi:hypothetical protein